MGWPVCNSTVADDPITETPLWHSVTFHDLGRVISAIFALIAVVISSFLIFQHATHYSKPYEQRHIIRVLHMIPIYAVVSLLSYIYFRQAVYFEVIRDFYEALALASFFTLLCHYIEPNLHDQKEYFRRLTPIDWILPVRWFKKCCGGDRGCWRTPRSGLTWFNVIWLGVFQYCFLTVFLTIVSVITQATGKYCESSLNPAFAHIWVMVIEATSVTVAMYCLIQFYIQLKKDLAPHRPFLKLLSIKLVIFFSFWQTLIIDFLTFTKIFKASDKIASQDIKVGIPSMLLCIEMAIFSVMHLFSFPWKEYRISNQHDDGVDITAAPDYGDGKVGYHGGFMGCKAFLDAFNPWDLIKAVGRSFKWLFVGRKNRHDDLSYTMGASDTSLGSGNQGGNNAYARPGPPSYPGGAVSGGKPGKYQPLEDSDGEELLPNAQPNPVSGAMHPAFRQPGQQLGAAESGDMGMGGGQRWNQNPDNLTTMHPTPGTMNRGRQKQQQGVIDLPPPPTVEADTGYHGAQPSPAPPMETGNADWNMWGRASGNESRDSSQDPPSYERR